MISTSIYKRYIPATVPPNENHTIAWMFVEGLHLRELRSLLGQLEEDIFLLAGRAYQIVNWQRMNKSIIVAVVRENEILLAHNKNFRLNWYSVIAGFVEPGETFEDCVIREVMEEVGIRVKNIQYFGSQPWPFPDSLMVGFIAEYESGDITVDGEEIDHAAWYECDNLPPRPTNTSIAGRLIEAVVSKWQLFRQN